ncbi:SDR family NAD(P)-dependent oxidoreductase [Streptomyces sp. NPDC006516]|uniref:SDR family NAD(P)-dependent oxidoreductase n=1 Tax=Streptomyces sp. NPDC006516 TaxID=3154309 RepID=UPI0033BE365D
MTTARPVALVTGASSGIGLRLAGQLAERGFDLVINAEDDARLHDAARQVRAAGAANVEAVKADLRVPQQADALFATATTQGKPLSVVVLNAGVGQGGAFKDTDLADELEIIDLNIRSTVQLAKSVVRDMATRNEGRILVTSSVASMMPGSFQAVYNASKSFLQSFTQALQNELKDTGITLTSFMPGPTETDFFHRAGMDDTKVGRQDKDDPAEVARQALDALFSGKEKAVTGSAKTKAQAIADKVLPDKVKGEAHRQLAEPGSGNPE